MHLDRLGRDEERLSDVAVRVAASGQPGDAALAGRECGDARRGVRARPGAGRVELGARELDERLRAARVGQLERLPERLARLARLARPAQRGAERRQRLSALEPHYRALVNLDRLAEMIQPVVELELAEHSQRAPERAGAAGLPGALDLSLGEGDGLLAPSE